VVVLYSAARLPLRFPQPEGIARERKLRTLSAPPPPPLLGDGRPVTVVPPRDSGDPQPEWMAPPSGAAPSPPSGYVLSFVSFHEWGFGVPASHFMWAILHFYGVELHNLSPNSIAQAAIFAAVCEGFLGIDPH
jgi:hypothetical protein